MNGDVSKDSVRAARHKPTYDSESLNRAMQRAITDENFLDASINLLKGLKFPASKGAIVNYISNVTNDPHTISLFQNLDGYIQFKDQYHIRKAIEENDPKKKLANQITDKTRENPAHTQTTHRTAANSIKASQAVNESEQRKDFPEVNPTAMSHFICKKCGKPFQNQDDLVRHKKFEEGIEEGNEVSERSRTDRQQTVNMSPKAIQMTAASTQEPVNEATNKDIASRMANMLEGIDFPVTKEEIINHIQKKKIGNTHGESLEDVLGSIHNNLQDDIKYDNVYEIEKAARLVVQKDVS